MLIPAAPGPSDIQGFLANGQRHPSAARPPRESASSHTRVWWIADSYRDQRITAGLAGRRSSAAPPTPASYRRCARHRKPADHSLTLMIARAQVDHHRLSRRHARADSSVTSARRDRSTRPARKQRHRPRRTGPGCGGGGGKQRCSPCVATSRDNSTCWAWRCTCPRGGARLRPTGGQLPRRGVHNSPRFLVTAAGKTRNYRAGAPIYRRLALISWLSRLRM